MSSKGRCGRLFLRWCCFRRCFRHLGSRGCLLEVEVLQCHVQGHDLNTAHGLEISEIPQRAVTVILVLGGGGRGVLVGQQRGQQQLRHKQAPVGPLSFARLPLDLRQPRFAQPAGGESITLGLITGMDRVTGPTVSVRHKTPQNLYYVAEMSLNTVIILFYDITHTH